MLNFSYYLPTHFVFGRGAEEKAGDAAGVPAEGKEDAT